MADVFVTRVLARSSELRTVRRRRAVAIWATECENPCSVIVEIEHGQERADSIDWHRSSFVELGPQSARVLGQRLIEAARQAEGLPNRGRP